MSWQGANSPGCTQPGTNVSGNVTLAGPAGGAVAGSDQTISATVINNGTPVSGGTVTFSCVSGPCTTSTVTGSTNASGVATLTYESLVPGTDIWQASYTPASEAAEVSNEVPVAWNFAAAATPSTTTYGNPVVLSETDISPTATGTVTFTSGGNTLCTITLTGLAGEPTSCTTGVLAPGSYPVSATYSGDGSDSPAAGTTSFAISKAPSPFTAAATPSSTSYGNTVSLSASGLPVGATGTVTFTSGSSTLCSVTLPASSVKCTTAALPGGTYPVTASYSGNSNYAGSTASTSFTIAPAATSFTAAAAPGTTPYGNTVTLSASGLPAPRQEG